MLPCGVTPARELFLRLIRTIQPIVPNGCRAGFLGQSRQNKVPDGFLRQVNGHVLFLTYRLKRGNDE